MLNIELAVMLGIVVGYVKRHIGYCSRSLGEIFPAGEFRLVNETFRSFRTGIFLRHSYMGIVSEPRVQIACELGSVVVGECCFERTFLEWIGQRIDFELFLLPLCFFSIDSPQTTNFDGV